MDNKNGGQGGAMPSWNAWAAAAKNNSGHSSANGQSTVLTDEQLSVRRQQKTVTDLARKKLLEAYKTTQAQQGQDASAKTKDYAGSART